MFLKLIKPNCFYVYWLLFSEVFFGSFSEVFVGSFSEVFVGSFLNQKKTYSEVFKNFRLLQNILLLSWSAVFFSLNCRKFFENVGSFVGSFLKMSAVFSEVFKFVLPTFGSFQKKTSDPEKLPKSRKFFVGSFRKVGRKKTSE